MMQILKSLIKIQSNKLLELEIEFINRNFRLMKYRKLLY